MARLDALKTETEKHPLLRQIFERHALARAYAPGIRFNYMPTMPETPFERFDPNSGEPILDFIGRVWTPYLQCGFADAKTIKLVDGAAYDAIPWPQMYEPQSRDDFEPFMERWYKPLIRVGLVTRETIRLRDPKLDFALSYRLSKNGRKAYGGRQLDPAIVPPTFDEMDKRALSAPAVPQSQRRRLAQLEVGPFMPPLP